MSTSTDEEADALRRLVGTAKKSDLAGRFGIPGGASMLSQHLSGNRPISLEAGIRYARGFGIALDDLSPRLAAVAREAQPLLRETTPTVHAEHACLDLRGALETLGAALADDMAEDVRQDAADLLAKLAHRRGAARHQAELLHLLSSQLTKLTRRA